MHFVAARVGAHGQHGLPRLAAVNGLVDPAIPARRPERTHRRDVDHVGVARIHDDVADVLGVRSPTRFQVSPASVDLYRPSPIIALRGFEFSPVPRQMMFVFFGSTWTQHRLNDPPRSKIGVQVVPAVLALPQPAGRRRDAVDARVPDRRRCRPRVPSSSAGPMLRSASPSKTVSRQSIVPPNGRCAGRRERRDEEHEGRFMSDSQTVVRRVTGDSRRLR